MRFGIRKTYHIYFLLFFLLVIAISLAGLYYYNFVLDKKKQEVYSNLSDLANLKVKEIVKWRNERLGEAKFIQSNVQFIKLLHEFIKYPQSVSKKDIIEWLSPIKVNHEYVNISIISDAGKVYSLFQETDSLSSRDKLYYHSCIEQNEIMLGGFEKAPVTDKVMLGNYIPLFLPGSGVFGVMQMRIDPRKNLYPLVELTSTASKTAEFFLVRQDGDSVTFLNDIKTKKISAVSFKLPLSMDNLPAAMVIKGKRGIYEGVDFDGTKVLADLNKIPGSDWFIVSKINLDEVYEPVKEQALYIIAGVLTLILLSGAIVFIAWKNEKIKSINWRLKVEKERKDLFKNISEGYAYCRMIFEEDRPVDFVYLEVNDAFRELLGGPDDIVGKRVSEINPDIAKTNPEIFEIYGRVALTGIPEKFESFRPNRNKWFLVSVYSPHKGYFVYVFNDITEQKNSIIELQKLSSAVEQSPASVVITDLNGRIEYVNPRFTEVTGYTLLEALGKNPSILRSGKTPSYVFKKLWETITKGKEWRGELCNRKKNGELYWELVSISPIKNESGVITHYVAVKEDITKRKQIERELELSEERFRKMFENHKAVMLIVDPVSGDIVDANPSAVNFYGYTHKALCSMKIQEINQLPPEEVDQEMQKTVDVGRGYFIFPHRLADGTIRAVEVYSSRFEINKRHLLFSIIHDITERKRIEKELNESLNLYETLSSTIPFGMQIVDKSGNILYANEILKSVSADVYGSRCWQIYKDDKKQCRNCPLHKSSPTGTTTMVEVEGVLGGKIFQIYHTEIIYKGEPALLEIFQDVTQRRKTEIELAVKATEIEASFSNIADAILVYDNNGKIIRTNKAADHMLRYFQSDHELTLIERTSKYVKSWTEDNRELTPEEMPAYRAAVHAETVKGMVLKIQGRGDPYWVILSAVPLFVNGKHIGGIVSMSDITPVKKAEQAIIASEERFSKAFSRNPNALVISHVDDGTIIEVNETFLQLFGFSREEALGKTSRELNMFADPEDRDKAIALLQKNGFVKDFEINIKLKSGKERIALLSAETLQIKGVKSFLTIIQDITKRREMERELIISEQKYKDLIETQRELIVRVDTEGRFTFVNEAYCRKFGIKKEELIGKKSFKPLIYEEDLGLTLEKMKELEHPPYSAKMEQRAYTVDGLRWIEWEDTAIVDENGKIVEIQGVGRDIHERKQAEEALRESELRLMEAQQLTHIGSSELDFNSRRIHWSREVFNIYERDPELGEPSYDEAIEYTHPDDKKYLIIEMQKGSKANVPFEFEYRIIVKGKVKYLYYIGKPVFDASGKLIKRTGAIIDITERKLSQINLEKLLEDLKRSNKELELFAYTASHDLQEPIRMIKSYAQLLEMKSTANLSGNSKEYLSFISEGASRMQQLVNDLLKYSRVTTTKKNFEPVDCSLVLKDVLNDLKFTIQEEDASVEFGELPVVKGDRTQLRQVFQNLIQNAVKFKSDKKPVIKIKSERKDGKWVFSVSDNGIGIDPDFHERIFTIFQRLHSREKYPGTGIGLAVCKRIIERHGGQISVRSELNKGTTFYFTIPA
ncbi:MAG TPA: PAS domain S-box protein [Ignavibacteriaceae bacterium]|nr:PAS domain S-box protein [Ignavibacteriaceae bacterium]